MKRRVAALAGKEPATAVRVERGYSPAERWVIRFEDGTSAFAKLATTEITQQWLRTEHHLYTRLSAGFMPKLLGWSEDPKRPLLLLEDLSAGDWPPPWDGTRVERVLAGLEQLAHTRPVPSSLPDLETDRARFAGWLRVERAPKPFLALGLCSREWLEDALPVMLMAQDFAILSGPDLIHGDVRSDNLCLLGERVVFVDWNFARRGNSSFDRASLAPSLRLEGGPLPDDLLPDEGPLAALIAGYFAAHAGLPEIEGAPGVRKIQLRQLRIALAWAARAAGLPPPDGSWGRAALEKLDAELAAGRIDEGAWHAGSEEVIGDAYLAASDPRAQSGKAGDEEEWRWSRELALDALPPGPGPFHVLDIGCANGYLMESFVRWGRERRLAITPHGLDISPRLASLARRRLPAYAAHIAVGNLLDWTPPRRYDLVHSALDYVPPARRRESIERLRREMLAPGGRIVLRAERVRPGEPDLAEQVTGLGLPIGGVIERKHTRSAELRRSVWIGAE